MKIHPPWRAALIVLAAAGLVLPVPRTAGAQESPATTARTAQLPDSLGFVASSRGRVYYPRSCEAWHTLSPRNLIGFATEADARAAGYVRTRNRDCGWSGAPRAREPAAAALDQPLACIIVAVVDGDTIDCADGRRIRLLLIDSPEMSQGPYGRESRAALAAMLPIGKSARLEMDVDPTDRWGRTLAYVYGSAGRMVNEEMARLGYALQETYPPNVRYVERIDAAVDEARAARRGLWSGSAFECTPREYRAGDCRL